jgi:transposase
MASIQARTSRGKKYWSIVESRRINGKPRSVVLEYLGTPETLLHRLKHQEKLSLKSYSHGDTRALLHVAEELDVIQTINQHIPENKLGDKQIRDGLSVGASLLLAAIGRACHPTSKMGWIEWSKETSLEYCLRASFKKLNSQHFWDQMNALPTDVIPMIEEELVARLVKCYQIESDCLFFDTTNFFTFIDSTNSHCDLPKRGKNKQKRYDLRQIGMALLVTRKEQFPLFHTVYEGNKADAKVFKEELTQMLERLHKVFTEVSAITLVFDKGNNSKDNFASLDKENCYYVAGLVPSYFKALLKVANQHFSSMKIEDDELPIYRLKEKIWGQERTCVVTISAQLKEGQIRGIEQHLEKKYIVLNELKQKLERDKPKVKLLKDDLKQKLQQIIRGQFIEEILKFDLIKLDDDQFSFHYYVDSGAYELLKQELLGRQIIVTNRHEWASEDILKAYRGQCKVEYAFRTLKNPYHLAIRPQYHWTDQKIKVHFLICIIAYMLTVAVYTKARAQCNYKKNIQQLMDDLRGVRLACIAKKKSNKVNFQLEKVPAKLKKICHALSISDDNIRSELGKHFQ